MKEGREYFVDIILNYTRSKIVAERKERND